MIHYQQIFIMSASKESTFATVAAVSSSSLELPISSELSSPTKPSTAPNPTSSKNQYLYLECFIQYSKNQLYFLIPVTSSVKTLECITPLGGLNTKILFNFSWHLIIMYHYDNQLYFLNPVNSSVKTLECITSLGGLNTIFYLDFI